MKKYVIIVAGGSGTRMNNVIPKQFILLKDKPILMHTIEKFFSSIPEINIIVVLNSQLNGDWKRLCTQHNFIIPHLLVGGGETRFHSVKNGLNCVPEKAVVGVHDAARPLVNHQTIVTLFKDAEENGNATPYIHLNESIRELEGVLNKAVDRNKYVIIQTPQCFQSSIIKIAFEQQYDQSFTDDASVLEATGVKINLVEGNRENVKITTPQDLIVAEGLMNSMS